MENLDNTNEKKIEPSFDNMGAYYVPVPTPKRRALVAPMDRRDLIFTPIFIALVFGFFHFGRLNFNLGYTAWFVATFAALTAYLHKKAEKASPFIYLCGGLSVISAIANSIYDNDSLNMLNVVAAFILFAIYLGGLSGAITKKEGSYKLVTDTAHSVFLSPFSNLIDTFKAFASAFKSNKSRVNFNAVIGVLLAIPFLAVIIPLLASGDAAFNGLIDGALDLIISDFFDVAAELFVTLILAPLAISYAYSLKKKTSIERSGNSKKNRPLANSISVPFLSMISLTYIVYLFSQLAYFFSAFSGILPKNYEYSASVYARRGFYEIFVICIINISIITFVNLFTKKKNGSFSAPLKALECFICAISIVFIITAMAKMKMNIDNFGLSVNRMLVSLLELMLLVVIVFIIVHIFNPRVNYMQAIIIICSVLFIGFVYADADAIVAKYNVEAYRNGKLETVDVRYLGHELSDSAMPYIAELANDKNADGEIRDTANAMLSNKYIKYSSYLDIDGGKMTNNHKMPLERINLSREIACNVIADYYNSLDSEAQKEFVDNGSIYFGWDSDVSKNSGVNNNDWSYELPNDYSIWHVNSQNITCGKNDGANSMNSINDDFIVEFCYNNQYIGLKCLEFPISEPINDTSDVQTYMLDLRYYIIDTLTDEVSGPMLEQEYYNKLGELEVYDLDIWIKTQSRPDGATFK